MDRAAVLSPDGLYRYSLRRTWASGPVQSSIAWVMLNPSTADAEKDDPTIRKCIGFSKRAGFGSLFVVNLWAVRSTKPSAVLRHADPVGPGNDAHILGAMRFCSMIVCAWGSSFAPAITAKRVGAVLAMLDSARRAPFHLGVNADGQPKHPLMLPYTTPLTLWAAPKGT